MRLIYFLVEDSQICEEFSLYRLSIRIARSEAALWRSHTRLSRSDSFRRDTKCRTAARPVSARVVFLTAMGERDGYDVVAGIPYMFGV